MGGKLPALVFISLITALGSPLKADELVAKPASSPPKGAKAAEQWRKRLDAMSPEMREEVLKKIDELPQEEREKFKQNFDKWQKMDGAQRERLRERDEQRRKAMRKDAEDAIKQSGLNLTPDQREVFILRYQQERKKLESRLRQEMSDKRKQLLPALIARVTAEVTKQSQPQAASR
jgi:DNA-directed RNA polymerase specialized sigma24 family protein